MSTDGEVDLDAVRMRLVERGLWQETLPAVDRAVTQLAAEAPNGFELGDLLVALWEQGESKSVEHVLETVSELRPRAESEADAAAWVSSGRRPGAPGYHAARWERILAGIDGESPLGRGGGGLDERVIEYPWVFSELASVADRDARVLDAGSVLNHAPLLEAWAARGLGRLSIVTLAPESYAAATDGIGYEYADLRALPYRDGWFSAVICLSTLEHVGMDNTAYGDESPRDEDPDAEVARAMDEIARVTKSGGWLFVSVPFGRAADHGWFRVMDGPALDVVRGAPGWRTASTRFFRARKEHWEEVSEADLSGAGYGGGKADVPGWVSCAEGVALVALQRLGVQAAAAAPAVEWEAVKRHLVEAGLWHRALPEIERALGEVGGETGAELDELLDWLRAADRAEVADQLERAVVAVSTRNAPPSSDAEGFWTHPVYGYRFRYPVGDRWVGPALAAGTYEAYETELFASLVEPGMYVVDVGANLGHFSVVASLRVGPDGRVDAFEPAGANVSALRENVTVNRLTNVRVVKAAVSSSMGWVDLHLNAANTGDHRVAGAGGVRSIEGVPEEFYAVERVEAVTLDSIIAQAERHPDVVKIDTQGHEDQVFAGMQGLLEQSGRLAVFFEFWPEAMGTGWDLWETVSESFDALWIVSETRRSLQRADRRSVAAVCEEVGYANLLGTRGRWPTLDILAEG